MLLPNLRLILIKKNNNLKLVGRIVIAIYNSLIINKSGNEVELSEC